MCKFAIIVCRTVFQLALPLTSCNSCPLAAVSPTRMTVHILDDSNRPEMARLVRRLTFQCK